METESKEQIVQTGFSRRYEYATTDVYLEIERSVCGCDYGASSWTTVGEIERIIKWLGMSKEGTLLEIGTGSGWPGLFLAKEIGCQIHLTDLPFEGLQVARERAGVDEMLEQVAVIAASGAHLPYSDSSFDHLFHSDVLCCLPNKKEVLAECRRCVTDEGNMVFPVIYIAPNLSAEDHSLAIDGGPPFVDSDTSYPDMLVETGWKIVEQLDISDDYVKAVKGIDEELSNREDELKKVLGEEMAYDQVISRAARLNASAQGLLRRELFKVIPV